MLEFSHEANTSFQIIRESLTSLRSMTLTPQEAMADPAHFCYLVRRHTLEMANAFDIFVDHAAADARKKGLFPCSLPQQRFNGESLKLSTFQPTGGPIPAPPSRAAGARSTSLTKTPQVPGLNMSRGGAPQTARKEQQSSQLENQSLANTAKTTLGSSSKPIAIASSNRNLSTSTTKSTLDSSSQPPLYIGGQDGVTNIPTALPPSPGDAYAEPGVASSEALGADGATASTGIPFRSTIRGTGTITSSCVNVGSETVQTSVATGCYVLFDLLMRTIQAKEGMFVLNVPGTEEVQAVCLFGGKPRPPSNVRLSLKSGVVGTVIKTGIAVNVAPDNPTESNPMALCVPVFPSMVRGPPIGAVFAQRKACNLAFTKQDEELMYQWTRLAAQMVSSYNVNLLECYFDPFRVMLKRESSIYNHLKKLSENDPMKLLRGAFTDKGIATTIEQCGNYTTAFASMIASRPTQQLLFRCVHHNHFSSIRGAHLGGAGVTLQTQNLMDIAEYVSSVEECWKRTAEDLQDMESEQVANLEDYKERKKKLKSSQKKIGQLENVCQTYKGKYEGLKRELTALCGAPVEAETDEHAEDAAALGFNVNRRQTAAGTSGAGSNENSMRGGSKLTLAEAKANASGSGGGSGVVSLPAISSSPRTNKGSDSSNRRLSNSNR